MLRVGGALLVAFALGTGLGKVLLPVLHKLKFGQNIYELAPESHQKKQGTPTMGGFVVAGAAVISALVFARYADADMPLLAAMLLMALGNLAIGMADDLTKIRRGKNGGLSPKQKLVAQTALAAAFSVWCALNPQIGTSIIIPFLRCELNLGLLYVPIMTFVVVGTTNSANLLDGLDGLLSSVSMVDFIALAVLACSAACWNLGITCAAVCGGCMAFLLYNAYPAKVFLGDTGSMFLGGAVSAAAVMLRQPLLLILIAFWMMMSSISDLIQFAYFRKTHGKRFFKMAPIHHHFELSGMHEAKIVMMYLVTTAALCVIALMGAL